MSLERRDILENTLNLKVIIKIIVPQCPSSCLREMILSLDVAYMMTIPSNAKISLQVAFNDHSVPLDSPSTSNDRATYSLIVG